MSTKIAFLGLGNMGTPMATNLGTAGYRVTGYDPAPDAAAAARAAGVTVSELARVAVGDADIVITMLPSGKHVLECYAEILPHTKPRTLLLDCSTIDVADARQAAAAATEAGQLAADAPVSGGVVGAESGTLTFMAGGSADAFSTAEAPLRVMGARAIHCGDSGAGQAAKLCNNMVLGVSMIAVSEAFALGERLGLTDQALFDVASTASGQCWALTTNCPVPGPVPTSPANRGYSGGFLSKLMLKDLHLAQAAARSHGVDTALGHAAAQLYERFVATDGGTRDFSSIIEAVRDGHLGTEETA